MERATVNGLSLEYEQVGSGEPVLFVHGALVADAFRPLLQEAVLAGRYRLITFRRAGYGGSTGRGRPAGLADQVSDCLGLLRHLGIERAHVVGHSYGGSVALQMALDAPPAVKTLVLLEPALAVGLTGSSYRQSLARGIERFRSEDTAVVVEEFMEARSPGLRGPLERALPGGFEQAVADAETAFEVDAASLLEWEFGEADARRVDQRVLCVLGGDSNALWSRFGEVQESLLQWLPRAEGFVLPGATHFMQIEKPAELAKALHAFFARDANV